MKDSPCRDCKEREVGCHSYCELYQSWHDETEQENKKIRMKKKYESLYKGK